MFQHVIDQPWPFFGIVLILALLQCGASLRIRYDRRQKARAAVERRKSGRQGEGRRWSDKKKKNSVSKSSR
jgi:hypothetical protein